MEKITHYIALVFGFLIIIVVWFIIRKTMTAISDRINNAEVYKEDMLNVLEEIRDELKELNKNNSIK